MLGILKKYKNATCKKWNLKNVFQSPRKSIEFCSEVYSTLSKSYFKSLMQNTVEKISIAKSFTAHHKCEQQSAIHFKINQGDATLKMQLILANLQVERFRTWIISFPL